MTKNIFDNKDPRIALATYTIEYFTKTGVVPSLPLDTPKELLEVKKACFVTLKIEGSLRGCVGTILPDKENLALEIVSNAISACSRDPRFHPVRIDELEDLEFSVDVLSKPEKIKSKKDLDVNKYGVIVSTTFKKGLLLPMLKGINDVDTQVEIALRKAGIGSKEKYSLERFEVVRYQ